ncbi:hypothetical protein [Streptosporangium roseum]|uniref:PH domain-containing protein n=1 Tax=Streptosporangium roseum (strain ATCC 12428 / DSM 43021 / JCM 3005 / KCTC 9067 / NCIMB 10171 / NRRL 2505 / NI 9100) TaxID=479432 RepID=D2ASQ4_STRRD|nr:hypothetical protein [Streptosporangium roseum]ACZ88577.1 hypothetical protein Sros_5835 [Streptosporangium roseum DSM 43021]
MRDIQGDLVLRPDARKGAAFLIAALVATVAIVAAILVGDAPTVFAPIMGAVFAVLIALGSCAFFRARIVLTAHEIVLRGIFFQQRRSRSHAAEVVRATLVAPRASPGDTLFVLDAQRNLLIRVPGSGYAREDIDRLVSALGVPCSGPDHAVDANELAKTYPGLVPWVERHPYRFAFAFAVAGVVVAAVMTLVLVSISE